MEEIFIAKKRIRPKINKVLEFKGEGKGENFGSIEEMNKIYDQHKGIKYIDVGRWDFTFSNEIPQATKENK